MKIASYLFLFVGFLFTSSLYSQEAQKMAEESKVETDFSDRAAIIKTTENFFIGDHTGSIEHKKLSMHEKGAYRYVSREGEYSEFAFDVNSDDSDTSYEEELLSIEIWDRLAMVRLRLAENTGGHHYKMLTMHKMGDDWKITTITWGSSISQ